MPDDTTFCSSRDPYSETEGPGRGEICGAPISGSRPADSLASRFCYRYPGHADGCMGWFDMCLDRDASVPPDPGAADERFNVSEYRVHGREARGASLVDLSVRARAATLARGRGTDVPAASRRPRSSRSAQPPRPDPRRASTSPDTSVRLHERTTATRRRGRPTAGRGRGYGPSTSWHVTPLTRRM